MILANRHVARKTICLFMILQTEMWLEQTICLFFDITTRDVARKTICLFMIL